MKTLTALILITFCAGALVVDASATDVTREMLDKMAQNYRFFITMEAKGNQPLRFLYADSGPHLHLYTVKNGRAQLDWESTNLGSAVTSLMVRDLDKDGVASILVSTIAGRIVGFDAGSYERNFENFQEPFDRIQSLVAANLDEGTVQDEVVLVGKRSGDDGPHLYIFDSVSGALIHRSEDSFSAVELAVANVDDDPQPEIILNTGVIYDSRFYRVEPSKLGEGTFGIRMRLMDINGDDIPEVFGELPGFQLRVYDIYAQRELF